MERNQGEENYEDRKQNTLFCSVWQEAWCLMFSYSFSYPEENLFQKKIFTVFESFFQVKKALKKCICISRAETKYLPVRMRRSGPWTVKARRSEVCTGPMHQLQSLLPHNSLVPRHLLYESPLTPDMLWCQDGGGQRWSAKAPASLSCLPALTQRQAQQPPSSRWIVSQSIISFFFQSSLSPSIQHVPIPCW